MKIGLREANQRFSKIIKVVRGGEEVTHLRGEPVAPAGAPALNLAFDVTPNELISGIITEKGVLKPPYNSSLKPFRPHQE